jgi:glycine cleavage system transcriptional repressor
MQNLNFVVISAIAPNRTGIANEITDLITYCGCNIQESKMKAMGNTFSLVLMASGEWNAIAKLEHVLPSKAASMGMTTMLQRTEPKSSGDQGLPYRVKMIAKDDLGITKKITAFFADRSINIEQMSCDTYQAQQTATILGEIKLTVSIPVKANISSLREAFQQFCKTHNLDASFEAITA